MKNPREMGLGMKLATIDARLKPLRQDVAKLREKLEENTAGLLEIKKLYDDERSEILGQIEEAQKKIEDLTVEKENVEAQILNVFNSRRMLKVTTR